MKMTHTEYKNATKRQKEENEGLDEMKMPTTEELLAGMRAHEEFMKDIMEDDFLPIFPHLDVPQRRTVYNRTKP